MFPIVKCEDNPLSYIILCILFHATTLWFDFIGMINT